jgi:hypothetical protein
MRKRHCSKARPYVRMQTRATWGPSWQAPVRRAHRGTGGCGATHGEVVQEGAPAGGGAQGRDEVVLQAGRIQREHEQAAVLEHAHVVDVTAGGLDAAQIGTLKEKANIRI